MWHDPAACSRGARPCAHSKDFEVKKGVQPCVPTSKSYEFALRHKRTKGTTERVRKTDHVRHSMRTPGFGFGTSNLGFSVRSQEKEFKIQKEESGVWEAPQCADSDRTHETAGIREAEHVRPPIRTSGFGFETSDFGFSVSRKASQPFVRGQGCFIPVVHPGRRGILSVR